MRRLRLAAVPAVCTLIGLDTARAQRGTGDWMTSANDAQRSSWVRSDAKISPQILRKPGFELVWKMKFDDAGNGTLTPPALLDFYIGYRGFRALGFFGGGSNRVVGVDVDLARTEWEKKLAGSGSSPCAGGMTSAVTRPTTTAYPMVPTGRGPGRGTPAKSGVGQPHEGAVTIKPPAPPPPPKPPLANAVKPPSPVPAPNPFAARIQYVLALAGDGKLHSLYVSNGNEPNLPVQFIPPNGNARGLIAYDNTAYVATTGDCPGVDGGVWALDQTTKKVSRWKSGAGGVAGTAGPAIGPDGTLYVAGGNGELTALAAKTLEPKGSYKTGGAKFTSSPVVFEFKGENLIAAATNDGRLHLLNAATLSTTGSKTAPFSTPDFTAGALASWQDPYGTRWVLAPASGAVATSAGFSGGSELKNGAIVAWKVVEKNGSPIFEPGWVSRDLVSPLSPVVVNGVVFALSSGEYRSKDPQLSAAQRAGRSTNAVLYALDGTTGKELWNSGSIISSHAHGSGMAAGGSRVYVATDDGTQYAFSFPVEH